MILQHELRTLRLIHPFILSDSRIETKDVFIIRIEHEGITGIGESSPSRYYGEPPESVLECLGKTAVLLCQFKDPSAIDDIMRLLLQHFPENSSARSGIDMALHDWVGKKSQLPLYKFFELDQARTPFTSFTIGIDELSVIEQKIREAESYPILKIKLGVGEQDFEIIKTIRKVTDKILRVDVNEGWNKEEAANKIDWLAGQGVELIEQPLPKENNDDMIWLKQRSKLPLFADESVKTNEDISALQECFHGINIKLDKC
ncbi:dipeptide epimerase, partial [bacterium]|nr:dipeptide epimerase [bacterium]